MGKDLILTFDIGTTGNKCAIFDIKGINLHSETIEYKTYYPQAGWAEQKPDDFWQSVVVGTRKLLEKSGIDPSRISVIGTSGHMNGCIPVDKDGNALFNDIIHSDSRSSKECDKILEAFGNQEYYYIAGNRVDPHYSLPKIMWIKNNHPEIYKKTAYFINSKDYITGKLTGNVGLTDLSDASLVACLDIKKRKWSEELIKELELDIQKFPQLKKSFDIAGYVTDEAASLLGIKSGIPVVVGGGDAACATRGAGVRKIGEAYNNIGSSSWISILNESPVLDEKARTLNFYDMDGQNCNACGTVQCAAISYDWVINNIAANEIKYAKENNLNVYDYIDSLAEKSPVGSNGVFFLPYLMGERTPLWDKNTRGGFIGFTLFNKKSDLIRAAYEGIAYALRSVLEVFEDNNVEVDRLTLVGGGAKSKFWNKIICNVFQKPILIHKFPREATSLGAAIAAGVGVGIFKSLEEAGSIVQFEREYSVDKEKAEEYTKYYKIYKMMYPQLKPIFDEIANT